MRLLAEDIEFAESKKAMEDRMNDEADERGGRSSGGNAERGGTERSGKSSASAMERDAGNTALESRRGNPQVPVLEKRIQDVLKHEFWNRISSLYTGLPTKTLSHEARRDNIPAN